MLKPMRPLHDKENASRRPSAHRHRSSSAVQTRDGVLRRLVRRRGACFNKPQSKSAEPRSSDPYFESRIASMRLIASPARTMAAGDERLDCMECGGEAGRCDARLECDADRCLDRLVVYAPAEFVWGQPASDIPASHR